MRNGIISVLVLALIVACDGDRPTDPAAGSPDFMMAGNSGCFTVTGHIVQTGIAPFFSGTISGDIEGNVITQLDLSTLRFRGPTQHVEGQQTWEVTGGKVAGLTNVTLALESVVIAVQPPEFRNNTTSRVVSGAARGDLTYHGVVDISSAPPVATDVEYHGVICT